MLCESAEPRPTPFSCFVKIPCEQIYQAAIAPSAIETSYSNTHQKSWAINMSSGEAERVLHGGDQGNCIKNTFMIYFNLYRRHHYSNYYSFLFTCWLLCFVLYVTITVFWEYYVLHTHTINHHFKFKLLFHIIFYIIFYLVSRFG